MNGHIDLTSGQPHGGPLEPIAIKPVFYPRKIPGAPMPKAVEPHPLGVAVRVGDVYVTGPGKVQVTGMAVVAMERRDALLLYYGSRETPQSRRRSSLPWSPHGGSLSCCHARSALLRRSLLAAAWSLLPHGRPPRRSRAESLPRAGGLAWLVASAERPALPHRGLRGPPAGSGRGPRPQLASRQIVPAGAQVPVHPAALPLDLIVISGRIV
jgi:hypothetical protein